MTTSARADHVSREAILKLLSDAETAKVSTAEEAALSEGGEYVDLENLEAGVQAATASMSKATAGHIIPRGAVHEDTWNKIVGQLKG
jgi:hypothetical protein